jgi:hypothetical protein
MSFTWKFWNIWLNNIQLHSLNDFKWVCEYNTCIKKEKKKAMQTPTCVWPLHRCYSAMLAGFVPPVIGVQATCSVHVHFTIRPTDTTWRSHWHLFTFFLKLFRHNYYVSLHPIVLLQKYKNKMLWFITSFLLLYHIVSTCSGHPGPFPAHTDAMSEAKLYVKLYIKLQLKIREITLHKIHWVLELISYICCEHIKNMYIKLKIYYENKSYNFLVWSCCVVDRLSCIMWNVYTLFA